jgi:hypothetical protein
MQMESQIRVSPTAHGAYCPNKSCKAFFIVPEDIIQRDGSYVGKCGYCQIWVSGPATRKP